jgi:RNA polymerase sigma-70 factor (ECF subfamily)
LKHSQQLDIEEATFLGKSPEVVDQLSAKDILNLLNHLPEIHRLVFNLYEIDGYNHDEIGSMLSIPASSSRVYLSRAKEKLRTYLTQQKETDYERRIR